MKVKVHKAAVVRKFGEVGRFLVKGSVDHPAGRLDVTRLPDLQLPQGDPRSSGVVRAPDAAIGLAVRHIPLIGDRLPSFRRASGLLRPFAVPESAVSR